MGLNILDEMLRSHGAFAITEHELPPFCVVYQLSREGSVFVIQSALSAAGYEFASWGKPEFYREMLTDDPLSRVPATRLILPNTSRLISPVEAGKDYVLKQRAAFLCVPPFAPESYGLITPVTDQ